MSTITQNNKELVTRSCDAINEQDRDGFMRLQTADIVHHQGSDVLRGEDAVTEQVWAALRAFPDLTITPDLLVAEDDRVAMLYTMRGTHEGEFNGIQPTGKPFTLSEMKLYRISDGKIAEVWAMADQLGLLTQLGVVEQPQLR